MKQFIIYEVDALTKEGAKHFTFRLLELNYKDETKTLIKLISSKGFEVIKLLNIEIKRG